MAFTSTSIGDIGHGGDDMPKKKKHKAPPKAKGHGHGQMGPEELMAALHKAGKPETSAKKSPAKAKTKAKPKKKHHKKKKADK